MIKTAIAGASGYTGLELVKLISNHPKTSLEAVTSNSYQGKSFTDIFPSMRGFKSLICTPFDANELADKVDVVFLALPHKVSMAFAPKLVDRNIKVVDLSADFRFDDAKAYEAVYQPHTASNLLKESVYGLCELNRDRIKGARIIGNPGCYPTSILLPLVPLLKEKLISPQGLISDSKSGVSGAGRSLSLTTHYCEANEAFGPYKVGNHRHTPEINEVLTKAAGERVSLTFVPHLVPVTRGMVSTIYARTRKGAAEKQIRATLNRWYENEPFVRILPPDKFPNMSHVKGTNCCDIGFHLEPESGRLIIVSAIDNLLKGAAGQAVQNMNIMFEIDEKAGLDWVQTPL
ncbi:N-acetyl-gamma-glutamyl-phosphate reductase [Desulfobacter latus]|uniref:N-acetyl-gamma-glutamyl-phosphate reductase n=1 Tax=Desulfobacter latus TaxID=2292 RepID=A0A850TAD9_9BACT|nr:N-acetyl-gamma-glutamyl-phosphate reductase [Desulfobacter latus]NWH05548.1 N-acetyl-gamma-glutamyl-phosphate reductase [Desulfobacter latus]